MIFIGAASIYAGKNDIKKTQAFCIYGIEADLQTYFYWVSHCLAISWNDQKRSKPDDQIEGCRDQISGKIRNKGKVIFKSSYSIFNTKAFTIFSLP